MKVVLLCSGGFDSVVLANYVRNALGTNDEIETLFFDYGQKSCKMERECAYKVSKKINAKFNEITLPKFRWTRSAFYAPDFSGSDGEYLEMRNLVFISYALSLCESIGAIKLYFATLKSFGYYDTSTLFLEKIGSIANDKGIEIVTPFSEKDKYGLMGLALHFNIERCDFFSCDNPVGESPCGKCPDCEVLNDIMLEISGEINDE